MSDQKMIRPYADEAAKIKKIIKDRGALQKDIAKKSGLGSPSNFSQYLSGQRPLQLLPALKIASALECSLADFSPRLAREAAREGVAQAVHSSGVVPVEITLRKVPVLSYVQAGDPSGGEGTSYREAALDQGDYILMPEDEAPEEAFALVIKGDSMEPDFCEGDRIIVDPTIRPKAGAFVVARREDPISDGYETTFKKYRLTGYDAHGREVFELIPLNPDYPTYNSRRDRLTIIGVAISHNRPLL